MEIKRRRNDGESLKKIGDSMGVSASTIYGRIKWKSDLQELRKECQEDK